MAGLLDFYGDPAANMALAAGLLSGGNFGTSLARGMAGAQSIIDSKDERKRRNEVMQAQAENLRSEIAAREIAMQKQKALQALIGRYTGGGQPSGPVQGDSYMPGAPVQAAPQGSGMSGLFNPETLAALKLNGVDLVDVAKLAKPEWQNINGNMVNTNDPSFKGGFQPGMNASANGQLTMWQPDGKGGLVVGAPAGALDTYRAYQGAGEQVKNQNTLIPPDRIGRDGRPLFGTVDQLVQQAGGGQPPLRPASAAEQGMREQVQGSMGADPAAAAREIARVKIDLQNPTIDPASKQLLQQHLNTLMQDATKAQGTQGAFDGRMSNDPRRIDGNPYATQAELIKANKQAEVDVQPTQLKQAGIDGAINAYKLVDKALAHPGINTATGLSGTLDPRNYIPGTDAKNFSVLSDQLKGNVFLSAYAQLKGAGQITEIEGTKAENAIARMNKAQSTEEYKAALKEYQDVIAQGLKRMGVNPSEIGSGATGDFGAPKANSKMIQSLPTPNASNRGQRIRDTTTGKVLVSNGLQWKEE